MLNSVVELRQTTVLADFWEQVPHRGYFQEMCLQAQWQEGLKALEQSRFTGAVFFSRNSTPTGILAYCLGELLGGQIDGYDGKTPLMQWGDVANFSHFSSKRMVRSVVHAASALLGGDVQAQLTDVVPGAALGNGRLHDFSGVLAWIGQKPYLEIYTNGQLLGEPDPSMQATAAGPVLKLSPAADTPPIFQGLGDTVEAWATAPMPLAAPVERSAPKPLTDERIWSATLRIYEAHLGRGAAAALAKLQGDLANVPTPRLPGEIAARLESVLGQAAALEIQESLKE